MNTMTYKGYLGSVAFSEKDNVFFGKIEGQHRLRQPLALRALCQMQVRALPSGVTPPMM